MPRMRDLPRVVGRIGWWTFAKRVYQQVIDDELLTWAAALAYYWLFAVFPFLIFLLSLLPLMPSGVQEAIREEVRQVVEQVAPNAETSGTINKAVGGFLASRSGWLLAVGLGIAVWTASTGMAMTMAGLDKCYDVKDVRPYWKARLIATGLTLATAVVILAVLVLLPVVNMVLAYFPDSLPLGWVLTPIRYLAAVGLLLLILAGIYCFGPSIRRRFHLLTPGAVFVVALWLLLGYGLRVYVGQFDAAAAYQRTYGAVGGVAILLLLFYIDALVLMIGAEINAELDFALLGIPSGPTAEERTVAPKPLSELDEEDRELAADLGERREE